jgi:hypothetical protein
MVMHRRYLVRIRIAPLSFGGSVLVVFEEVAFSGTALVLPEGNVGFVDEPGVCDGVVISGSEVLLIFSGGERSTGADVSLVLLEEGTNGVTVVVIGTCVVTF